MHLPNLRATRAGILFAGNPQQIVDSDCFSVVGQCRIRGCPFRMLAQPVGSGDGKVGLFRDQPQEFTSGYGVSCPIGLYMSIRWISGSCKGLL